MSIAVVFYRDKVARQPNLEADEELALARGWRPHRPQ